MSRRSYLLATTGALGVVAKDPDPGVGLVIAKDPDPGVGLEVF